VISQAAQPLSLLHSGVAAVSQDGKRHPCILYPHEIKALPVTEYLNGIIIIQLSTQLPLLASGGALKNSLALRQLWRLIPPPALLLGGIKGGHTLCTFLVQVRVFRMTRD